METKKCKNCGDEFTSDRSTAKYCSDSCRVIYNKNKNSNDNRQRIEIFFTETELNQINSIAEAKDIPVEQFIKYRSIMTVTDINDYQNEIVQLKNENEKLKTELSMYQEERESFSVDGKQRFVIEFDKYSLNTIKNYLEIISADYGDLIDCSNPNASVFSYIIKNFDVVSNDFVKKERSLR